MRAEKPHLLGFLEAITDDMGTQISLYFGIGRYDIRWDPVEMWGAARVDTHALHTLWAFPPGEKRDLLLLHVDVGVCGLAPPP